MGKVINHPLNGNTENVDPHSVERVSNLFICHDLACHNTIWRPVSRKLCVCATTEICVFSGRSEPVTDVTMVGEGVHIANTHKDCDPLQD